MSFVIQDNQDGSVDKLVADLHYELLDDPKSPLCDSASAKGLPSLFGHSWNTLKEMLKQGSAPTTSDKPVAPQLPIDVPAPQAPPAASTATTSKAKVGY
jgi:hypothetical protein